MPTYEYACQNCGHDLEVFQRMSDDPLEVCPSCNEPSLKRKIGLGAGIIFKGGGFYETDFKDRKGSASGETGKAAEKKPEKKETPAKTAEKAAD
ncbi:MAG: FmdB family zinc ribbon protein [Puniceicoccaceae bacterium]